jgi:hypothetical protein
MCDSEFGIGAENPENNMSGFQKVSQMAEV